MSIRYQVVKVRLSEVSTRQVAVPPWEVPILQAVYGGSVEIIDEEIVDRVAPTADDEYKRLVNRYSPGKEGGASVVAQVYGLFEAGIDKLDKEIGKAETDEDADHAKASKAGKDDRLKALKEKQKADAEAFKAKQDEELKQAQRDADARIRQGEQRNKEDDERRDQEDRDALLLANQRALASPVRQAAKAPDKGHDAKK